jgi:YebC/PmpR family DNA-binding regulatory protein
MSGHSKWATIHRQKEIKDAKKGQVFTKIANAITLAVREGNANTDPESNFKLRLAMDKAKAVNMPKDNIQRAIDRGKGGLGGVDLTEVIYEGYGPAGVGIMVEVVTDNKQRIVQEVKNIFERSGGSLAGPGAVVYQFQKMGLVVLEKNPPVDEQILSLIDLGAKDVEEVADGLEVYTDPGQLAAFKTSAQALGYHVQSSELVHKPVTEITITDRHIADRIIGLLDSLDQLDDVQRVWANAVIAHSALAETAS